MMVRKKLAVVVAALSALQSGVVSALGLGELSLDSAINQPLAAEIKLLDTGELDASQIRISLGSKEDFERAGVSREFFLTNIRFDVKLDSSGEGKVTLTSRERVLEPYLDFIIEARWPNGRLLREYTVLLDLPVFSQAQAANIVETVAAEPKATGMGSSSPSTRASVPVNAVVAKPSRSRPESSLKDQHRVKQNETLWEIAAKARPNRAVTVQQTMVGIQKLNPNAFINSNINSLKAGTVLRLPTEQELTAIDNTTALSEVSHQNRVWQGGESVSPQTGPQLDATATSERVNKTTNTESRLSIATQEGGVGESTVQGEGKQVQALSSLQSKLDVAEEQLDKSKRSNDEMAARLNEMEAKMATVQRLLELKESQLAELQAARTDETTEGTQSKSELAPVVKPKPTAPVEKKPEESQGLLDQILASPLYIGLSLLVMALAVVIFRRRAKPSEPEAVVEEAVVPSSPVAEVAAEEVTEEPEAVASDTGTEVAEAEERVDTTADDIMDSDMLEANVGDFASQDFPDVESLVPDDSALEVVDSVSAETGDAIAEADIYIAYGRSQQAIDLLLAAIGQEPARSDLYVKLLEIYIETRDRPAFQQYYADLLALGDNAAIVQVKDMLSSIDGVADWLDDLPSDTAISLDEDLDVSLDLDLDVDGQGLESEVIDALDDNEEFSLDLELDTDDLESESDNQGADMDLSLDDELDLDLGELSETLDQAEREADFNEALESANNDVEESYTEQANDPGLDEDFDLTELNRDLNAEVLEGGLDIDVEDNLDLESELDLPSLDTAKTADTVPELVNEVSEESQDSAITIPVIDPNLFEQSDEEEPDDFFDFLAGADEIATKLDLARAYLDMGDTEGARDILDEVMSEGNDEQKQEAGSLIERID